MNRGHLACGAAECALRLPAAQRLGLPRLNLAAQGRARTPGSSAAAGAARLPQHQRPGERGRPRSLPGSQEGRTRAQQCFSCSWHQSPSSPQPATEEAEPRLGPCLFQVTP